MIGFRLLLVVIFTVLTVYTLVVITNHGINLLPVFFGDMAQMAWPGQFNLDFMCFLALSALWVAWRHQFSGAGLALGVLAFFGGAVFLSVYLFIHSFKVNNNLVALLLGPSRVNNQ
ncbi:MAG: hypothetical protein Q8S94_10615 [Pseudohongiella sp.]|nr:hypothetical protein [Pseudohongiella sp.]MDP3517606.1 hypothetical protein [Pseudohongiella sp.]